MGKLPQAWRHSVRPDRCCCAGAVVTLTNKTTGVRLTQTTNLIGSYRFTDVPPGAGYEVSFSAKGFTPLAVKDIYLSVATVRTQNATLLIGAHEEVQVSAANSLVTIDTTDATVGNDLPVQSINSLPCSREPIPLRCSPCRQE